MGEILDARLHQLLSRDYNRARISTGEGKGKILSANFGSDVNHFPTVEPKWQGRKERDNNSKIERSLYFNILELLLCEKEKNPQTVGTSYENMSKSSNFRSVVSGAEERLVK